MSQVSANDFQVINWMEAFWSSISDTDIRRIKMPGTHDSGAFSPQNTPAVRDQEHDLGGQLREGARYLDIRITTYGRGCGYTMFHETYPGIGTEQDFVTGMEAVYKFLVEHPYECVILRLTIDKRSDDITSSDSWYNILRGALGSLLLQRNSFAPVITPNVMKNAGQRVLVVVDNSNANHGFFTNSSFSSSWTGNQQNWTYTFDEQASYAHNAIESAFTFRDYDRFLLADAYVYGLDNKSQEMRLHSNLLSWLGNWKANFGYWNAANIIGIDFIGVGDDAHRIAKDIIRMNVEVPAKPSPYGEFRQVKDLANLDGQNKVLFHHKNTQRSVFISKATDGSDLYVMAHFAVAESRNLFTLEKSGDAYQLVGEGGWKIFVTRRSAGDGSVHVEAHPHNESRNRFQFIPDGEGTFLIRHVDTGKRLFVSNDKSGLDLRVEAHDAGDRNQFHLYEWIVK